MSGSAGTGGEPLDMIPPHAASAGMRRRRERRVWRAGLLASLLVHLLVLLLWRAPLLPVEVGTVAAGPAAGDASAAAGALQALNLRPMETTPVSPPPVPVEVAIEVDPIEIDEEVRPSASDVLGQAPTLEPGPGLDQGTGKGNAGDAESGLSGLRPPAPQGMIIPPTNRDLRGSEIEVWVFVDAAGRVVPDSTRLQPPTRDRSFNERLLREAAQWVFRPATLDGAPVAAWFPYRIIM